jgi:peptidoglycan/xylan/chitin deacetylase (PgdA/CDA1 family)
MGDDGDRGVDTGGQLAGRAKKTGQWRAPAIIALAVVVAGGVSYSAIVRASHPAADVGAVASPSVSPRADAVPEPTGDDGGSSGASDGTATGGPAGAEDLAGTEGEPATGDGTADAAGTEDLAGTDGQPGTGDGTADGAGTAGGPHGEAADGDRAPDVTGEAPRDGTSSSDGVDPAADPPAVVPHTPVDCAVEQCVALTFDDGPDLHSDAILDALAAKGVRATFFIQGYRVEMFTDQLRREVAEGHEIGNHTWNHKNLTTLSARAIRLQIAKTNKAVELATGVTPGLVRPPYGNVNQKVKEEVGLPLVMWSVDTRDWETKNVKKILKHIKKETKRGSIILMHDTVAASGKALGRAIDILHEKGFTLVTVSELLGSDLTPGQVYSGG